MVSTSNLYNRSAKAREAKEALDIVEKEYKDEQQKWEKRKTELTSDQNETEKRATRQKNELEELNDEIKPLTEARTNFFFQKERQRTFFSNTWTMWTWFVYCCVCFTHNFDQKTSIS